MNPHLIKPKSNNEVEPDYVEYKLANSEIINKTRYFIQCLIQDRGNIPKQLLGSFDDLLNQCIDVSARSDAIPEPIIIQLEHFAKVFDDPPEHYFLFGQYANADGDLQLCFLTNNDITGGNSGSPIFDKNARLIGLAFDGNWEAMSGDIAFEPELQRCIGVDIRAVLFMIDKWGKCPRLIEELKLVR